MDALFPVHQNIGPGDFVEVRTMPIMSAWPRISHYFEIETKDKLHTLKNSSEHTPTTGSIQL
ncbi:hypothetical protein DAEQUDRAFT_723712 [Daedalea quercina L-15889]|uniref:Uncharacterized protein n=1 Tax=Daedalea quercina L-15889 TaxID=1314783 RepID=A0A165S8B9_9APHY|nr:hypothetical protein DAEQUDRAFT_723712 [Daedalea quercina L-15889]